MVPDDIPYLPSQIFLPFLCCIDVEFEETACMVGSQLICGKPDE